VTDLWGGPELRGLAPGRGLVSNLS
jgi:hypothetical protein